MNLRQRSYKKELLDGDHIPFADILQNMHEIHVINAWLGGHKVTLKGFKDLLGNRKHISICEIGCGNGNNLQALSDWCTKNDVYIHCIGIDIKEECIQAAQNNVQLRHANWQVGDYRDVHFDKKPDIIFSSLFCHHFTNDEILKQLDWMKVNSNLGFFINDLHRHHFAYHSIKMITSAFAKSYLAKHDAPLSVARGFKKKEWEKLLCEAGLKNSTVEWVWAFRHLITYRHDDI